MSLNIVADADLAAVAELFGDCGELDLVPGREIAANHLRDADVLLIRSITRVDEALLQDSAVKFVGSATSGADHVDLACLERRGISFADARGCNANAVVDYCLAALAWCVTRRGLAPDRSKLGIIGYGHVGSLLARRLQPFFPEIKICDPPLAATAAEGDLEYCEYQDIAACDVVSLHVPLETSGNYPTLGLVSTGFLELLPAGAILINTCRGGVVDEQALLAMLRQHSDLTCIVDVWENEPAVNAELVRRVALATPHIAGYSQEAKLAASLCLRQALGDWNPALKPAAEAQDLLSLPPLELSVGTGGAWDMVLQALPLAALSERFKAAVEGAGGPGSFDALRRDLAARREFQGILLRDGPVEQGDLLRRLGFGLA